MTTKHTLGQDIKENIFFISVPLCAVAGSIKLEDMYKTLGICLLATVICIVYKLLLGSRIMPRNADVTSFKSALLRDLGFIITPFFAVFADIDAFKWLFLFGVVLSAVLAGLAEAFMSSFAFALIITVFSNASPEFVANSFLIAMVAIVLTGYYSDLASLIYCIIILLSFGNSFFLIFNGIKLEKLLSVEHLIGLFILVISMTLGWYIYAKKEIKKEAEDIAGNSDIVLVDYTYLLEENYPIFVKMKADEELFKFSDINAGLAKAISEKIGARTSLCEVGTFYAECGRSVGSNYIKEGLILAKETDLPEEIVAFIKEHNFKVGNPKSRETGIAMLVCKLSSTIKYLDSKNMKYSANHVVNEVMDSCLMSGKLTVAGLSLDEYKVIKDYLLGEVKSAYDYFNRK